MRYCLALALGYLLTAPQAVAQTRIPPYRESGWCSYHYDLDRPTPSRLNLPDWACRETFHRGLQTRFVPDTSRNPFFLSGDFDGDGRSDIAIWVRLAKGSKRGVLILTRGGNNSFVAGAGNKADERGDDYTGLDVWSLVPKGEVFDSPYEDRKLILRGDALLLEKSESAAFLIYWDGKKFAYYQLSD